MNVTALKLREKALLLKQQKQQQEAKLALEQKEKDEQNNWESFELSPEHKFHMVIHQRTAFPESYPESDIRIDNCYRLLSIEKIVEQYVHQMKTMTVESIKQGLKQINLAIDPLWLDNHLNNLPDMSYFHEQPIFNGGTMIKIHNHLVFAYNKLKSTKQQIYTEFMGLLWLDKYATDEMDVGRGVAIHIDSYKLYMSMMIGLEFFHIFREHEFFKPYVQNMDVNFLTVFSKEFGSIKLPSEDRISSFGAYVEAYPFWGTLWKEWVPGNGRSILVEDDSAWSDAAEAASKKKKKHKK
jgi:hypothetical protein